MGQFDDFGVWNSDDLDLEFQRLNARAEALDNSPTIDDDEFLADVVVESPVPLEKYTAKQRIHVITTIAKCTDCTLHQHGHATTANSPSRDIKVCVLTTLPTPTNRLYVFGMLDELGVNREHVARAFCINCGPVNSRGRILNPAQAQHEICSIHAIATLKSMSPEWIFLVGQHPVDLWQGWTGAGVGRFFDATGAPTWKRPGKKGVKKISKTEQEARRSRKLQVENDDVMRVGVWPAMGAKVLMLPGKDKRRGAIEGVLRTVLDDDFNVLDNLSLNCVVCYEHVKYYDKTGLGYCGGHWTGGV